MGNEKREQGNISPALREILVKVKVGYSEYANLRLPKGIANYYGLRHSDSLLCELVEVRKEVNAGIKSVGEEVILDIVNIDAAIWARLSPVVCELYKIGATYSFILLRIKEPLKR